MAPRSYRRSEPSDFLYQPQAHRPAGLAGCFLWIILLSGLLLGLILFKPQVFDINNLHLRFAPDPSPTSTSTLPRPAQGSVLLTGDPTLSADFINQVLARAHSPAAGTGQQLYQLSQQYQIDDAYALAFFREESQYATTGVARLTHSLGNIRCTPGYQCQDGYRSYTSYPAGYQDWYALLKNLYINTWHLTTVATIVPRYAPKGDGNDPAAYIQNVLQSVAQWQAEEVQR